MRPGCGADRRGFTLVELLVVVAVIALLIGLLLPALSRARHAAQAAMCLANIRSLEIAQIAYANDYDGQLVMYGFGHGGTDLAPALSWLNVLRPYGDSAMDTKSPLDTSPYWTVEMGGTGQTAPGTSPARNRVSSYGLNEYVTPKPPFDPANPMRTPVDRLHKVKNPTATSQFVMMAFMGEFAASDHVHSGEWWIDESLPEAPAALASEQVQTNAVAGRTGTAEAKANYGFLDGHAATMTFGEMYESPAVNKFDPRVAR